jgi:hypothetical protein
MATHHVDGIVLMDVCEEHITWALEVCGEGSRVRPRQVEGVA